MIPDRLARPHPHVEWSAIRGSRLIVAATAAPVCAPIGSSSKRRWCGRLEINEAILEVIALIRGEMTKNAVSANTQLAKDLPAIQGDRVQLQQMVLNLIINAIEAMNGMSEGARELLISTERADLGGVLIAVRDSGPGFAPESASSLFESFYTTKPGGLGMGLSICHSIIEAHEGTLQATASLPHGAVFQFTLPAFSSGDG